MADAPVTPVAASPNLALQNILTIIQEATIIAGLVAPLTGPLAAQIEAGSQIALSLETILASAIAVHQQALGSPMDLTRLHQIEPSV